MTDSGKVYEDVAHIQPLTQSDILEFYRYYITPSSSHRAKASVYLRAQSIAPSAIATETNDKLLNMITKALGQLGVSDIDKEKLAKRLETVDLDITNGQEENGNHGLVGAIRSFLEEDAAVAKDQVSQIIDEGKAMLAELSSLSKASVGLNGAKRADDGLINGVNQATTIEPEASSNGIKPVFIEDVPLWKAGMEIGKGARPVKDLSEFEDIEPKL